MKLVPVSVESPASVPLNLIEHSESRCKASQGEDTSPSVERQPSDSPLKQLLIQKALRKIAGHGLCGREHVSQFFRTEQDAFGFRRAVQTGFSDQLGFLEADLLQ
jgi:hypothetical protein